MEVHSVTILYYCQCVYKFMVWRTMKTCPIYVEENRCNIMQNIMQTFKYYLPCFPLQQKMSQGVQASDKRSGKVQLH